jgi:hypothetical protein
MLSCVNGSRSYAFRGDELTAAYDNPDMLPFSYTTKAVLISGTYHGSSDPSDAGPFLGTACVS